MFAGEGSAGNSTTRDISETASTGSSASIDTLDSSRDRPTSARHISQMSAAGAPESGRKSKGREPMTMLARSSSVAVPMASQSTGNMAAAMNGRTSRTQSVSQSAAGGTGMPNISTLPAYSPPAAPTAHSQASSYPMSPNGSSSMLSSWLTVDHAARNEERGRRNRRPVYEPQHIFQALDASSLIVESSEADLPAGVPLKAHAAPNNLLIRCKTLAWNFASNCEVLQCTISLHDVSQRTKLSEDFHFDFIDEMEQSMLTTMLPDILGTALSQVSAESKARRALFPLSYRSGSIYLLVRIRAVLKADPEDSLEPYTNQGKMKDPQRWMDSCAKSTRLLAHLRQPLAWGAIQVFNDASRLLLHDDTQVKLYRMRPALDDETFYDTITSTEKMKLAKQLEGALSLSGFLVTPEKYHLQNVIDSNLTKKTEFSGSVPAATSTRTAIPDLVKEVREFSQPFHQVYPNVAYENQMFVYPLQVEVKNAAKIKVKSVAVRAFLMSGEGVPERDALAAIHGASNNPNFVTSWTTTVDLGEKSPLFFDEIKIALPVKLTETFHLYFQVYAINHKVVDPKKNKHADLKAETLIGTAWMPLFKDNKFANDSTYTVAIQPVMDATTGPVPAGYLDSDLTAAEDKMALTFRTRLVSSLYTTNAHLASFYTKVAKSGEDYLRALEDLAMVPDGELLFRFAPILNFLFSMLCCSKLAEKLKITNDKMKKDVTTKTFLAIVGVASKITALTMVNGQLGFSEELLMYVSCHFDPYRLTHSMSPSNSSSSLPTVPSNPNMSAGGSGGTCSESSSSSKDSSFQLIASSWAKVLKSGISELKTLNKGGTVSGSSSGTTTMGNSARLASISVQELGWFFLALIVRSLALKITERKESGTEDINRSKRYPEKFSKSLTALILLCHDLRRYSKAGFEFFNRMLARFIVDLYRYMDRGFVSQLVSMNLAELEKDGKPATAFYRFKFLQEISEYEHYVPLNLPSVRTFESMIGSSWIPASNSGSGSNASVATGASSGEVRLNFWRTHFLAGHFINEFRTLLQLGEEGRLPRMKAIAKLRDLMWRHSVDPRYNGTAEPWQQRLASMYFPLAMIAFEQIDVLLGATSGLGTTSSSANTSPEWKDWCYVVIWILRHCNRDIVLKGWRSTLRPSGAAKFFRFLRYCHETFAKPLALSNAASGMPSTPHTPHQNGPMVTSPSPSPYSSSAGTGSLASSAISGLGASNASLGSNSASPALGVSASSIGSASSGGASSPVIGSSSVPPLSASALALAAQQQQQQNAHTGSFGSSLINGSLSPSSSQTFALPMTPTAASSSASAAQNNAQILVNEVVLTIVDVLDHFIDGYEKELSSSNQSKSFSELASLIVALLRSPTSSLTTCATIGLTRFFCASLRKPLFRDPNTISACSDLCSELLALCQQQHQQVMAAATAVLYLMLKQNYEEMGKDFSRMRRNTTVALSNALKASISSMRLEDLNRSLEAMSVYSDSSLAPGFTEQVKSLVQGHRGILRDCTRVEQFTLEFLDLKLESSYNIANAYRDCPELRLQWLVDMAKLHEKCERYEDAAMCKLQAASLVGQYLSTYPASSSSSSTATATNNSAGISSPSPYPSIGINNSTFIRLAPELIANEEPLGATPPIAASWFTEESLLTILMEVCNLFAKAEQFESAVDVLSMYVQVCMDTKKYAYIAQNGSMVQDLAAKADTAIRSQSRIAPNFYRVGFYGNHFGEDNGKEFVYKALPSQRLADFSEKLVSRYTSSSVQVEILNNKPIAEQTLQPSKNYVQIVNLEPYFESDVNKEISWLDRTRNIKNFYYETSYSPDAATRPSEDVAKMFKRRELVYAKIGFPNFFMRVPVERKETKIMQPHDCALDLMIMLTTKLKAALNCVPIVAKKLQIILQGAVLAQVNAGPAAIIATFLANSDDHPADAVEKLRESIKAFIRACNFGLILNKKLVEDQPDTAALQEAMMTAFANLQAEASKYIDL